MLAFFPVIACVTKPTMLLRERVVVDDCMSVSSSVVQKVFAEVLCNDESIARTAVEKLTHSFRHETCRTAG